MQSIPSRVLLAACVLLLPLTVACERPANETDMPVVTADDPAATDAPPAELQARTDAYVAAWNQSDPDAVAEFYTDDATATVGDTTYRGREEIQAGWLQNVPAVSNLQVTETSTRQVGEDWRSEGTYSLVATPPDGDSMDETGRYDVTWTRDAGGEWRIRSSGVHADEPAET
jgi:uncharacterized protein (TIGR02246 family)